MPQTKSIGKLNAFAKMAYPTNGAYEGIESMIIFYTQKCWVPTASGFTTTM